MDLITTRRWRKMARRSLECVNGHRHKLQPILLAATGLGCIHRDPPGQGVPCGALAFYFPAGPLHAYAVEATIVELMLIGEECMALPMALRYLGVRLTPEVFTVAA